MRVVHLTTLHPSDDSRIFHKECRSLAAAGYDVVLIAPEAGTGRQDAVEFRSLPRVRNRAARVVLSGARALRAAIALRGDIYHFHDPELLPVGVALRALGKTVIYDAHERLPQQMLSKPWIPARLRRPVASGIGFVEWMLARTLSGVVAATPSIAERFPRARTACIQNFPILSEFPQTPPVPYLDRLPIVSYVGGVERIRGAREMVLSMAHFAASPEVRLCIAGKNSDDALRIELADLPGSERVEYLGWLGRGDVASLLARSRVGLVLLHPTPAYVDSYPIKLFEYMAAGIPVVASDFPLWRSIIEAAGCGILVDPLDPAAIADATRWLLEHSQEAAAMGERGRLAVLRTYSWKSQAEQLLAFYARLTSSSREAARRATPKTIPTIDA